MSSADGPRTAKIVAIIAIPVVIIAALAFIFVPGWYAASQNAAAPERLSFSPEPEATDDEALDDETTEDQASAEDFNGEWAVSEGSQAGYRIDEILRGEDITVVGRTEEVTGTVTVSENQLSAATIEVDAGSITTDSDRRDEYFRAEALQTAANPVATFELTEPVAVSLSETPSTIAVTGDLTLGGQTRPVTGEFEQVIDGDDVVVTGAVAIEVTDFGITAPNMAFVQVESEGEVEFLLRLTR